MSPVFGRRSRAFTEGLLEAYMCLHIVEINFKSPSLLSAEFNTILLNIIFRCDSSEWVSESGKPQSRKSAVQIEFCQIAFQPPPRPLMQTDSLELQFSPKNSNFFKTYNI